MSNMRTIRAYDLRDLRIREVRSEGSVIVPPHHHPCAHLTVVASGTVSDSAGDALEVLHAGDVLFRPAGSVHENLVAEPGSRGVVIELEDPLMASICDAWKLASQPIRTDARTLHGLPFRLIEELATDDSSSPLILRGLVLEMFGVGTRVLRPSRDARPPWWVHNAVQIINDRYAERLTIGKVAKEVGIPAGRLRDGLRRWYGNTFSGLLRDRRISAATALFDSELSMEEIAALCGFYDQSHFTRAFRAARGTTPQRSRLRRW